MSSSEAVSSAAAKATAGRPVRAELIETVRLALPIALTQLGQIAMMTTDLALIGRLGDAAIAAASLAHTIFFAVFVLGMGAMSAVAPLVAQAFGAREPRSIRRSFRVGLWLAVIMAVPLTPVLLQGEPMLIALGQTPESATLADRYLEGLTWSLLPGWWFIAIRGFMGSVNRPEPALWITLIAIPANALLGYLLIYGEFGFPKFDLLGAGLATTIVNIGMCVAGFLIAQTRRPFRKFHPLSNFWRSDWPRMRQLVAVGAPISGSFLLEYGLFASAALLMGWIGTTELAAHQIALQTAAILFMVPYGISMAATVRVGQAVGRGDTAGSRRAGFVAIALAGIFMAFMTLLVIASRFEIARFFLGSGASDSSATAEMVALLLIVGATFFICDGLQTAAAGALRGLNDTRVPLMFAATSFWLIGFSASYILGFPLGLGAVGVWVGFSCGLVLFSVLLILRFRYLTRRGYLPEMVRA
ncbi:MATE family efflux transporter [Bradyrhizobium sp. LHD-71]|uniref:MATE family efflux transporter n=1 Tax=Bradyrhizobium sp. LHD-71 TaxID=3072141 RepID=UPI00280DA36D|nr:MATE family efflux transporter [Bradyrhizobium sp. LHD-71]MDQ8730851.1 MATE family efflux transporter [Bradyrhizobium sp. LHD-71]